MASKTLLLIPFSEIRHDQPDDCLHYESLTLRGTEMNWTIPAHRHEGLYQFQMLETGGLTGSIEGREIELKAPALLMMPPGAVHGFTYTQDSIGHQLTVPINTLRCLLSKEELPAAAIAQSIDQNQAAGISALYQQVASEFNAHSIARVGMLMSLACLIAVHYLRMDGAHIEKERFLAVRDTLTQRFLSLVDKHYLDQQPLSFYADTLHVTPDHLSRTCRSVISKTAQQVLHERLMLEARRLLAYTNLPVAQVAEQLGYADPAYFTKFFTRAMQKTPSAYRSAVAQGVSRPLEAVA